MPKVGGRRKKHRTHRQYDTEVEEQIPKSFVFKRGKVPASLKELVQSVRKCMYPNTAMKLEDSKKLRLKAYVRSARYYGVSHLICFHSYSLRNYVRFIKLGGPIVAFRIINYATYKDVQQNVQQSMPYLRDVNSPLLVLNNFNDPNASIDLKRIAQILQSLFPPLNMDKIMPQHLKRVVSFTYKSANNCIYFRNYRVQLVNAGIDKNISQLIDRRNTDFSKFKTFSEFMKTDEATNENKSKQAVRLKEVGPRMKLKFHKFQESLRMEDFAEDEEEQQAEQNQDNQQNMDIQE